MRATFLRGGLIAAMTIAGCRAAKGPDAYGNVEAVEVVVGSQVAGQLQSFIPKEGNTLSVGAVVAVVDTSALVLQLQQAIAQRTRVRLARRGGRATGRRARGTASHRPARVRTNQAPVRSTGGDGAAARPGGAGLPHARRADRRGGRSATNRRAGRRGERRAHRADPRPAPPHERGQPCGRHGPHHLHPCGRVRAARPAAVQDRQSRHGRAPRLRHRIAARRRQARTAGHDIGRRGHWRSTDVASVSCPGSRRTPSSRRRRSRRATSARTSSTPSRCAWRTRAACSRSACPPTWSSRR